jgi:hypothetical protein
MPEVRRPCELPSPTPLDRKRRSEIVKYLVLFEAIDPAQYRDTVSYQLMI